jgi:hypothetical protein
MNKFLPFLFLTSLSLNTFANSLKDFEGEYVNRHSLYITSEDRTVHNVEDFIKIQKVDDNKANILIETYTQNFHSCQLVGEATLQGDALIFKSSIDKKLNRGKSAGCSLKISYAVNSNNEKSVKVEDDNDNCRLRYCGMTAELGGEFKQKSVVVQDKN